MSCEVHSNWLPYGCSIFDNGTFKIKSCVFLFWLRLVYFFCHVVGKKPIQHGFGSPCFMHILVLICNQLLDPVCTVEFSSDDHLAVSQFCWLLHAPWTWLVGQSDALTVVLNFALVVQGVVKSLKDVISYHWKTQFCSWILPYFWVRAQLAIIDV